MPRWYESWRVRHQHPISFVLHLVAIPMIPWALGLAGYQLYHGAWSLWWRPVALLVLSYGLQWIGHVIEGNDMGEVIVVKKLLGRPYVAVAPRYGDESIDSRRAGEPVQR